MLASAAVACCAVSGCLSVVAGPGCPGGYCAVDWFPAPGTAARAPRDPASVRISTGMTRVSGVRTAGQFVAPLATFDAMAAKGDACPDEFVDWFRRKAAGLGFDGVDRVVYDPDGQRCVGYPYVDEPRGTP
ncbi:MAG: hypothetical protein IT373_11410 [Polyangiaceae bacterium]|nr:hypothetical protein [Polyangiaceae bacterium]